MTTMINYADKVFTRTFTHEGKKLYATFHPEVMIDYDNYETTGRYLVVLLHPHIGLQAFYLNFDDRTQTWAMNENSPELVDDELMEWLGNQIEAQRG